MITCLNCGHSFEGNYCPNCGQSANTKRIGWSFIRHDLEHFIHFDKSQFSTLWQLMTRPGEFIREFIDGKRKKYYYYPLTLLLLIGGAYGLLNYLVDLSPQNLFSQVIYFLDAIIFEEIYSFPKWIVENYAFLEFLVFMPIFAIASYLAFYQDRLYFWEHVVLSAYLSAQRIFIGLITFPILYLVKDSAYLEMVAVFTNIIELSFTIWAYLSFFKEKNTSKKILLLSLMFLIILVLLVVLEMFFYAFPQVTNLLTIA